MASRLESSSEHMRIQCSKYTYKLLKDKDPNFIMEYRGIIDIKGKGPTETYYINSYNGNFLYNNNYVNYVSNIDKVFSKSFNKLMNNINHYNIEYLEQSMHGISVSENEETEDIVSINIINN